MANIKSAVKRIHIAERNRLRNKSYRSAVRTLTKRYYAALDAYAENPTSEAKQEVEQRIAMAYSKIDKAVKRGVYQTNAGARKKSRLAQAWKKQALAASS